VFVIVAQRAVGWGVARIGVSSTRSGGRRAALRRSGEVRWFERRGLVPSAAAHDRGDVPLSPLGRATDTVSIS